VLDVGACVDVEGLLPAVADVEHHFYPGVAGLGVVNDGLVGEVFFEGARGVAGGDVPALFHIRYYSIKTNHPIVFIASWGRGDIDIGGPEWINLFLENDTAHVFIISRLETVRSRSFARPIFPKAT
jgi:hypothetical protein